MFRKLINFLKPPQHWRLGVIVLLGILAGLGIFILRISKVHSYLSDSPNACVNCHIMAPQYATWSHSAHREWASCNDCHVPHNNVFQSYYFKAKDGLRHATFFTLRLEPQVIQIKEAGIEVVQENCIRCHDPLLTDSRLQAYSLGFQHFRDDRLCWECHRETPHGRVNSLSSVPYARVPVPTTPVPSWLKKMVNDK